jgi:hypothetical protein
MPTPKQAADALIALTTSADTHITALRPLLAQIDAAEATLRGALTEAGQTLLSHLAFRNRVAETARQLVERDLGQTLTEICQTAFATELSQAE